MTKISDTIRTRDKNMGGLDLVDIAQVCPDLRALAVCKLKQIDWEVLEKLSGNKTKIDTMKTTLEYMAK